MAYRIASKMGVRARALRKAMTEPEIMLWARLKTRGTNRPIFRRQYVYETVIFDFYCAAAALAIEIDGATRWSEDKQAKDFARDRWLASRGIDVLRLGAGSVYRDVGAVADAVILRAEERIRNR